MNPCNPLCLVLLIVVSQLSTSLANAQKRQRVELYVETGHNRQVNSVAFSPNGKTLAAASEDETVTLWDAKTGQELRTLTGHLDGVTSVSFSPDGRLLASSGGFNDNTIRLWDARTGKEIRVLSGHTELVSSVVFSPNGKTLASGSRDNAIKLWSVATGREILTMHGHQDSVLTVAFSPDGKYLASGSDDQTIRIWNASTGKKLKFMSGKTKAIVSVVFSPDGATLASGSGYIYGADNSIKLWNIATGREVKSFNGHSDHIISVAFSPDGRELASASGDLTVKIWDVLKGEERATLRGFPKEVRSVRFSPDGKTLASASFDTVRLSDVTTSRELLSLDGHTALIKSFMLSPDGNAIAVLHEESKNINLFDLARGQLKVLSGHDGIVSDMAFSRDGRLLASKGEEDDPTVRLWDTRTGSGQYTLSISRYPRLTEFSPDGRVIAAVAETDKNNIQLFDMATGLKLKALIGHTSYVYGIEFSPDGQTLVSTSDDQTTRVWDVALAQERKIFNTQNELAFAPDGKTFALAMADGKTVKVWSVEGLKELFTLTGHPDHISSIAYSPTGRLVATADVLTNVKLWDARDGDQLQSLKLLEVDSAEVKVTFSSDGSKLAMSVSNQIGDNLELYLWDVALRKRIKRSVASYEEFSIFDSEREIEKTIPEFYAEEGAKFQIRKGVSGRLNFYKGKRPHLVLSLVLLDSDNWVCTTPDGRFDTNKSLDRIEGLHWIINEDVLRPLPLDIFVRQYYEPGLLRRALAGEQFNALPSISDVNHIQPKVAIKKINLSAGAAELIDVTVEVESVTEDVSTASYRSKTKRLSSRAFDLRLFRDGQLVGVSTPKDKLAKFINDAPRLMAETKAAERLVDTPEDRGWREANDVFKLKADNITLISPERIQYTFRNVKLPKDGRKEVEFTAYAFNADKVKSTTTEPFKFTIPAAIANAPRKGRAFVLSIGVNASESPGYDLRYAANDARKMQEILGARLKEDIAKYSEVIQIPLISDYGTDKKLAEHAAQKAIIKGVFSLLAGNEREVPPDVLKQIPNRDKIKAVEPEDTLIITYAGHGYADQAGIFYLLPYDIGKDTRRLTTEALRKTISSDELSLWMLDITAAEMIMIIDACHSSAAVQGDGFKPGPMGSRGLGQLAYDKDMKILSATQADNVALELNSLQQGLLSYALLQDGIINSLADTDKNKQLFAAEWLSYAEKRVPELYQEVRDGKRGLIIDGRNSKDGKSRAEILGLLERNQKSSLNLQQPSLFDFKRRSDKNTLLTLP